MARIRMRIAAGLVAGAALLSGCGSGDQGAKNEASANAAAPAPAAPAAGGGNLAAVIQGNGELSRFQALVANAGVGEVLAGVGPYTVFAPNNAGLEGLGPERLQALSSEAMRPQAVALLRAHMVPGTLTRRDLMTAISRAGGQPVRMRTMAGNMLSFSQEGDAIVVASDDGARARITGEEQVAANGAVLPVDGALRSAR